ncbi:MAG: ABC transporter substrate-binding protein [Candidatus Falkowbacteria bacterium]|nr:ABC transporter substrate-binding protein [Candidatus Falkowbacteria bacterium]
MSKRVKFLRILYVLPLLLVLVLAGCSFNKDTSEAGKSMKVIKLGAILPLSGDAGAYGEQVQNVIDYQLVKVNEKYKDKGIKFEVIYEDGKCTGNDAVNAFQKLTEIDGVKFIIGGFCSSETLAMIPLVKDGKVLLAGPGSSNPQIEKANDYVFSFAYSDNLTGEKLADEMSKYKKVAIISEQNDYNIGLENAWMESLKKYPDVKIVASEKYPKSGNDFRNVLEKVRAAQPDALLLNPNAGAPGQSLIKQLSEIKDWNNYKLFGQIAYMNKSTLALAPKTVEGMIIVDAPQISSEEFKSLKNSIESEKGTLGDLGDYFTASTADNLDVMSSLIVELGEDPIAVRKALVSRDFSGYISKSFNFKNSSFTNVDAAVYVIKNNQPELVK